MTRHYHRYMKGESVSTNPIATLFAWTGALGKRGELDGNEDLVQFSKKVEQAAIETIESGIMTKDLAGICTGVKPEIVTSDEFLSAVQKRIHG